MENEAKIKKKSERHPLKAERFVSSLNNLEKHLLFKNIERCTIAISPKTPICKMYLQTGRVINENSYCENTTLKSLISWKDEIKKAIK